MAGDGIEIAGDTDFVQIMVLSIIRTLATAISQNKNSANSDRNSRQIVQAHLGLLSSFRRYYSLILFGAAGIRSPGYQLGSARGAEQVTTEQRTPSV
jgi:hypothetical protein